MAKQHSVNTNQLRIIGGQWRGRKLAIANIDGLRPTGDRIRETLFNWLMADIPGSSCLDLFAGSGALGLESLSRGAKSIIMLEKHPTAARQLLQHCTDLKAESAQVIQQNTLDWLRKNELPKHSVHIAFIDPPFAEGLWEQTITSLEQSKLLAADAMIYMESPKKQIINTPTDWQIHREKTAGDVCYRLYRNSLAN